MGVGVGDCIIVMHSAESPHGRVGKQKGQGQDLVHKLRICGLLSGQRVNREVHVLELG